MPGPIGSPGRRTCRVVGQVVPVDPPIALDASGRARQIEGHRQAADIDRGQRQSHAAYIATDQIAWVARSVGGVFELIADEDAEHSELRRGQDAAHVQSQRMGARICACCIQRDPPSRDRPRQDNAASGAAAGVPSFLWRCLTWEERGDFLRGAIHSPGDKAGQAVDLIVAPATPRPEEILLPQPPALVVTGAVVVLDHRWVGRAAVFTKATTLFWVDASGSSLASFCDGLELEAAVDLAADSLSH